jgi:hypothetical protein
MVFDPLAIELADAVIEHVPLASVQLPSDALFVVSVNVTVPVGVFDPFVVSVTVAFSVVEPAPLMLLGVAVTAVAVASAVVVTVTVAVPLEAVYVSATPPYAALMVFDPTAIAEPCPVIEQVPADSVQLPSDALFVVSVNVTVPVGVFAELLVSVTVAVNVVDAVFAMVVGFATSAVDVAS